MDRQVSERTFARERMKQKYDVAWAAKEARAGRKGFAFFWSHRSSKTQAVRETCLSQWYPSPFRHDGKRYATAEHWMMAGKARLFGSADTERAILATEDPRQAKELGRKISGFDGAVWERERVAIVYEGNLIKFRKHPRLAAYLMRTHPKILVEASPNDAVWGIGLGRDHPFAGRPENWPGQNLLGFCLMAVRDQLISTGGMC